MFPPGGFHGGWVEPGLRDCIVIAAVVAPGDRVVHQNVETPLLLANPIDKSATARSSPTSHAIGHRVAACHIDRGGDLRGIGSATRYTLAPHAPSTSAIPRPTPWWYGQARRLKPVDAKKKKNAAVRRTPDRPDRAPKAGPRRHGPPIRWRASSRSTYPPLMGRRIEIGTPCRAPRSRPPRQKPWANPGGSGCPWLAAESRRDTWRLYVGEPLRRSTATSRMAPFITRTSFA